MKREMQRLAIQPIRYNHHSHQPITEDHHGLQPIRHNPQRLHPTGVHRASSSLANPILWRTTYRRAIFRPCLHVTQKTTLLVALKGIVSRDFEGQLSTTNGKATCVPCKVGFEASSKFCASFIAVISLEQNYFNSSMMAANPIRHMYNIGWIWFQ